MSTETNHWGTIIGRPRGLTNGSMGGNGAMGGGIPPPAKGSIVLDSPSSLIPLVLTIFYCLILLDSSTIFSLNWEEKFSSSNRVGIDDTPINGSTLKLFSILISTTFITSSILDDLRLVTIFFILNANLGF